MAFRQVLLVAGSALVLASAQLAPLARAENQGHHAHPAYWRHDPNRWNPNHWNPAQHYNHWNRPCGDLGCDPNTWAPARVKPCGGFGCNPNTWSWSNYRNWGWWSSRAATWEIGSLAAGAIIGAAVTSAMQANQNSITVPGSAYELQYGSVRAVTGNGIRFLVSRDGVTYQMDADCQDGELNGYAPNTVAEAQLLNAACQIAYSS